MTTSNKRIDAEQSRSKASPESFIMKEENNEYTFAATCGAGTESIVAEEIENCGGSKVEQGKGVVNWCGDLQSGYRSCLWSRFASRILLQISSFPVSNEDSLYEGALGVDWSEHLDSETTFAVDCTVAGDSVQIHSRFAALRVKDAVVDQIREQSGNRPSIDVSRPGVRIHVLVKGESALLAIDLSGDSLHKRGYRVEKSMAPLKETLAAAIVENSGWRKMADTSTTLVDPMCGSGTLLIEAALVYGDIAPGLSRSYFGFMGWKQHDRKLWNSLVQEALNREDAGNEKEWPVMIGFDSDYQTVRAARMNVKKAGLDDRIRIEQAELAFLEPPGAKGLLLSNLPFGERLSETEEVAQLYRALGRIVRERFNGWKVAAFISNPDLTDSFNLPWEEKYRLYNGSLPCRLLVTGVLSDIPNQEFEWRLEENPAQEDVSDFANRFRKNFKKGLKWAVKEGVSCFRVYDKDLPEYNVSIDVYGKWIHVQEYAPPATVEPEAAAARFQTVLRGVRETLNVRADRVFIKTREKQRGKKQYEKKSGKRKMLEVREGSCYYLANFTDYLDTGVFLDHRPVRAQIHNAAAGKKFLNLFGYTGTATVQAAAGGAVSTTTVDLSATYLSWAKMNLALNGFDQIRNKVVSADCMQWLREDTGKYDLIFVDPPTFSNTKKEKRVFDVQQDHYDLINLTMSRLADKGLLIFSTNFRRFKLDPRLMEAYEIKDISRASIPADFSRNQKIHMCWELRKRTEG
jgi:23S rRNA (guanine2445-N2)-methyltransferase / 23S rRNA (guanine2069-N7)-methyltransferase